MAHIQALESANLTRSPARYRAYFHLAVIPRHQQASAARTRFETGRSPPCNVHEITDANVPSFCTSAAFTPQVEACLMTKVLGNFSDLCKAS